MLPLRSFKVKVVNDYKVSGIPTKFIIGPDQKIRFTAVGYSGNNDELVEELKIESYPVAVAPGADTGGYDCDVHHCEL